MTNDYIVMGVDPGNTTGVFVYFEDGFRDWAQLSREDIAPYLYTTFERWCASFDPAVIHVGIERYIITQQTAKLSQQPDALEVTGLVKGLAQVHGMVHVHQHMKANLKYAQDDMLRGVGWHQQGMRHANDAARQAFATLKGVDYPAWSNMVSGAMMNSEDEGRTTV